MLSLKEIERLHGLGFALHWLKPNSKVPVNSGWTSGERLSLEQLKKSYRKGYNIGVRLGKASRLEKDYLAVIDLDVKSNDPKHAGEAQRKLLQLFPKSTGSPKVLSGRGNGSAHFYVRVGEPASGGERKGQSKDFVKVHMPSVPPSAKEKAKLTPKEIASGIRLRAAWEISLLSEGRQVVLPGSIHPDTGRAYTWANDRAVGQAVIPQITVEKADSGASKVPLKDQVATGKRRFPRVNIESLGLRPEQVKAISEGLGVTDRSAACFSLAMAMLKRHVSDEYIVSVFTNKEFFLGQTGYDHAKTNDRDRAALWIEKYCLRKAKEKVNESSFDFAVKEVSEDPAGADPEAAIYKAIGLGEDWQRDLDLQRSRADAPPTVKATFKNIRLILKNEVSDELLRRNLFTLNDIWSCDTPWGYEAGRPRSGNVDDALHVKDWLIDSIYAVEASVAMVDEALNTFAVQNSFHPVKDFLESLEWDGVERVEKAFHTYLGGRMPKTYQREVSRKFFLALVSRIYEPGCKFDHMPVLEGKQGVGKSTFGRIIVGDEWFMDGLPEFSDKDAALNLQGIWLCELSELATIYRSANEQAKSFIARQVDKIRPPYGHRRVDYPRSSVFLGTTNARDYLTDSTGNRRFWPIEITRCDFAALKLDREQLLAEAKFLYDNLPEPLYLDHEGAETQAKAIQESRRVEDEGDAMESKFLEWLGRKEEERAGIDFKDFYMEDLFDRGPFLGFQKNMPNRRSAGDVLRRAGYRKRVCTKGKRWTCISVTDKTAKGGSIRITNRPK